MSFWDFFSGSGTKLEKANKKKIDIIAKCKAEQAAIQQEIDILEKDEAANPKTVVSTVAPKQEEAKLKADAPKQEEEEEAKQKADASKTGQKGGGKRRKQKSSKKMRGGKRKNTRRK